MGFMESSWRRIQVHSLSFEACITNSETNRWQTYGHRNSAAWTYHCRHEMLGILSLMILCQRKRFTAIVFLLLHFPAVMLTSDTN
ncbi:uncharacterized protein ARMOST_08122 [Armillaria ostoyae]|uniref:Uncharacterized protein n=1 Tax=Armillaria ostoyae TaxID=47428 RepID=A0A284R7R1_ARMOS|nr:uncharacterized protein ARMOST_08122 [Armillaria ostoyae]